MKYRNTKTGAVVDFKSKIIGGYWQPLVVAEPPKVEEIAEPKTAKKKKAVKKVCNTQQ